MAKKKRYKQPRTAMRFAVGLAAEESARLAELAGDKSISSYLRGLVEADSRKRKNHNPLLFQRIKMGTTYRKGDETNDTPE